MDFPLASGRCLITLFSLINDDPLVMHVTWGRGWRVPHGRFTRGIRLPFGGFSGDTRRWIRDGCTVYTPGRFHGIENLPGSLSPSSFSGFGKIDMQGRQRSHCRHDRMRLVDSNEVIRAQKRRAVQRELFIGSRSRWKTFRPEAEDSSAPRI